MVLLYGRIVTPLPGQRAATPSATALENRSTRSDWRLAHRHAVRALAVVVVVVRREGVVVEFRVGGEHGDEVVDRDLHRAGIGHADLRLGPAGSALAVEHRLQAGLLLLQRTREGTDPVLSRVPPQAAGAVANAPLADLGTLRLISGTAFPLYQGLRYSKLGFTGTIAAGRVTSTVRRLGTYSPTSPGVNQWHPRWSSSSP